MEEKLYYVYILTNQRNTTLYTGITSNLAGRVEQHKTKQVKGFTNKYNLEKLVHVEIFEEAYDAISREKQIKAGSRAKKIKLIEENNPDWRDLSDEL